MPHVRTCFGFKSFSVAAPTVWNVLPFGIRNRCSIASFCHQFKTFFQLSALPHPSLRFGKFLANIVVCFIRLFTYLFTYLLVMCLSVYLWTGKQAGITAPWYSKYWHGCGQWVECFHCVSLRVWIRSHRSTASTWSADASLSSFSYRVSTFSKKSRIFSWFFSSWKILENKFHFGKTWRL